MYRKGLDVGKGINLSPRSPPSRVIADIGKRLTADLPG